MGKSTKIKVHLYGMSIHYGVCWGPVDKLISLTVKEKQVRNLVPMTDFGSQFIDDQQLFGGKKKEGGVEGTVYFLPGAADQVLPDNLAVKLGVANGAGAPGYRGISSLFFTGEGAVTTPGFYWTANSPYLPGTWAREQRIYLRSDGSEQWYPEKAGIPSGESSDVQWTKICENFNPSANPAWDDGGFSFNATLGVCYSFGGTFGPNTFLGDPDPTTFPVDSNVYLVGKIDPFGRFWSNGGVFNNTGAPDILDMNPAHIIRECLTDTAWGMGSPATALDDDSFTAAANTLYDELFGLSMLWDQQKTIQDFISDVLGHIQAVLFVDPRTGLLTLKLIRGDYDPDTLPEINPDNAILTSFGRKIWGEIVNEIVVSWTNPRNEQEETVIVQDLASIAAQGGIVTDNRQYSGIRRGTLASFAAKRELRSAGAPLAACEAEVDRTLWEARPASCFKLVWPEYGLAGVIMRATEVGYGRPGDPTIKLSLIEDVFGLDAGAYVDPPSSLWINPSAPPGPLEIERVFTMPLRFAVDSTVAAFVDTPEYPEVVAGVLGTTSQVGTMEFEVWDEVAQPDGSTEWESLGEDTVVGHAELVDPLVLEATTTGVTFANMIGQTSPHQAGFVLIGDGTEAENEIALITVDEGGGAWTLSRGVLDTVPHEWDAGTPVWFVDDDTLFEDPTIRSSGEAVSYKLLSVTSQGLLPLGDADLVTGTLSDRPWQPNRPAGVTIGGGMFNTVADPVDETARPDPWVTVDWTIRNRLFETTVVAAWDDATMAPETGQTTTITVMKPDRTVLTTEDGLTGTTFDVPDADFAGEGLAIVRVSSKRSDDDGDFESLQAAEIWVLISTQELDPGLFTNTQTFFAPTVSSVSALAPALFTDGDTFFGPTVTAANTLTPSLFTDADTFFAPTVSTGAVTLTPSLFTDGDTFYGPTVTNAALAVYFTNENLGAVTEAAGAFTDLADLGTVNLAAASNYLGIFSSEALNNNTTGETLSQVLVNGSSIHATSLDNDVRSTAEQRSHAGIFFIQNAGAATTATAKLQGKRGVTGTATFQKNRLSLLKMGANDVLLESLSPQAFTNTTTNKTAQVGATLTFTPPSSGDYLIIASFISRLDASTNVFLEYDLFDGTTSTEAQEIRCEGGTQEPAVIMWRRNALSGSKSYSVRVRQAGSGVTITGIAEIRMAAIRLDRFANVYSTELGADSTSTVSTYTSSLTQTFTPAAADHLTLASWVMQGTGSNNGFNQFLDDATTVNELMQASSNNGFPGFGHRIVAMANSSRTQALQRKASSGATTHYKNAAIVTLDLTGIT